jgi:hypothetical protein
MKNALYVYPEAVTYGEGAEPALVDKLAETDRVTQTPYVGALSQLQLNHEGELPGGYRYTSTAFKQVCGLACPGLHQAVVDLSGIRRTSVQPRRDYSFADAIEVFNRALRIRYQERFEGKVRLIRDVQRHLVEGMLGPKYNYLENRALYDMARDAMASSPLRVRFLEAVLEGRRLLLRFVHVRPLFVVDTGPGTDCEPFSGGYHVSNSEVGEASVRVTTLLYRHRSATTSLGPFPGRGPLAHTGKDFVKKVIRIFAGAVTTNQDGPLLARRMQRLREMPLDLGQGEQQREERLDDLSLLLHRQNVPRSVARRIILATMSYGSDLPRQLPRAPDRLRQGRTWFDLYSTLTRESRGLDMTVMEAIEQAAFQILLGRITDKRMNK